MSRRARVLAPYATVKITDSATGQPAVVGFYQGAVLPPEADPENVASLVRREYAEWLDAGEEQAVEEQEDEQVKAQEEAAEQRAADAEAAAEASEQDADVEAPVRPAVAAPKAEWVSYAVAVRDEGVSEEDARAAAEAKTKAELVEEFGG